MRTCDVCWLLALGSGKHQMLKKKHMKNQSKNWLIKLSAFGDTFYFCLRHFATHSQHRHRLPNGTTIIIYMAWTHVRSVIASWILLVGILWWLSGIQNVRSSIYLPIYRIGGVFCLFPLPERNGKTKYQTQAQLFIIWFRKSNHLMPNPLSHLNRALFQH